MNRHGRYRLMIWGLGLLLVSTVASAVTLFVFRGWVDFPFFLEYDAKNKVISYGHPVGQDREETTPRMEAHFDVYYAHLSGLGPDYERGDSEAMRVDTIAGNIELKRFGEELWVNGRQERLILLPLPPNFSPRPFHATLRVWKKSVEESTRRRSALPLL